MKKILSITLAITLLFSLVIQTNRSSAAQVSLDKCKVTISGKYYYTGEGITPTPKVVYKKKKLKINEDYTAYYANNVNVGTATVTLVGMGRYTGSATASFEIKKGKQTITASNIIATFGDDPINIAADAKTALSYSSSNKKVAKVNAMGVVTVIDAGKAKITIKAEGTGSLKPAKKVITVNVKKAKASVIAFGGTIEKGQKWDVKAESSSGGKLTYSSSNKKIGPVSKKGVVKGKKLGTVTITVKAAATRNYKGCSTKVKVRIKAKDK